MEMAIIAVPVIALALLMIAVALGSLFNRKDK
jgi:hypothetical protein